MMDDKMYQGTAPLQRCYGVTLAEALREARDLALLVVLMILVVIVWAVV